MASIRKKFDLLARDCMCCQPSWQFVCYWMCTLCTIFFLSVVFFDRGHKYKIYKYILSQFYISIFFFSSFLNPFFLTLFVYKLDCTSDWWAWCYYFFFFLRIMHSKRPFLKILSLNFHNLFFFLVCAFNEYVGRAMNSETVSTIEFWTWFLFRLKFVFLLNILVMYISKSVATPDAHCSLLIPFNWTLCILTIFSIVARFFLNFALENSICADKIHLIVPFNFQTVIISFPHFFFLF